MKIKVMLRKTKDGGIGVSKKDIKKIQRLYRLHKNIEVEYVHDKFTPK